MGLFDWLFRRSQAALGSSTPPWADGSTRCLNAYIQRDYSTCAKAGREALAHQFIPTVGLVSILALRRLGRLAEAEAMGRELLMRGFGPGGMFLLLMRVLDGDLDAERFLKERGGPGGSSEFTPELECQVYFYWGSKLLTEGKFNEALRPLLLAVNTECDALERRLADADLRTAGAQAPGGTGK